MRFAGNYLGTLKLKDAESNKMRTITGINEQIARNDDVEDSVEKVNYLFAIGSQSVVADENARLEVTYSANDD